MAAISSSDYLQIISSSFFATLENTFLDEYQRFFVVYQKQNVGKYRLESLIVSLVYLPSAIHSWHPPAVATPLGRHARADQAQAPPANAENQDGPAAPQTAGVCVRTRFFLIPNQDTNTHGIILRVVSLPQKTLRQCPLFSLCMRACVYSHLRRFCHVSVPTRDVDDDDRSTDDCHRSHKSKRCLPDSMQRTRKCTPRLRKPRCVCVSLCVCVA